MVRIRDYREGETLPARLVNTAHTLMLELEDIEYEAWHPEATSGEEYNLMILVGGVVYAVMNIDFE